MTEGEREELLEDLLVDSHFGAEVEEKVRKASTSVEDRERSDSLASNKSAFEWNGKTWAKPRSSATAVDGDENKSRKSSSGVRKRSTDARKGSLVHGAAPRRLTLTSQRERRPTGVGLDTVMLGQTCTGNLHRNSQSRKKAGFAVPGAVYPTNRVQSAADVQPNEGLDRHLAEIMYANATIPRTADHENGLIRHVQAEIGSERFVEPPYTEAGPLHIPRVAMKVGYVPE